jgi:ring-1,2-phenylacetyl-CoA epoxidase subunit PaaB
MDIWEVFLQKGSNDPFVHVGQVLAPDREMATIYAKECFFRRSEGRDLWIVRREDINKLDDQSILEQVVDKSYRYPEAYRDVVSKREKAHAKYARSAPRADSETEGDEF